jgi:hypothetical protein
VSDDARRPSTIPWWYVGGFVVTLVVNVFLSHWLHASSSSVMVWGAIIGTEFRHRRLAARAAESSSGDAPTHPPAKAPTRHRAEAIAAMLITAFTLGLGLVLGFVVHFGDGPRVAPGPAIVGAVMMLVPLIVAGIVILRRRKTSPARTP